MPVLTVSSLVSYYSFTATIACEEIKVFSMQTVFFCQSVTVTLQKLRKQMNNSKTNGYTTETLQNN